jgi:hypothetical protein
MDPTITPLEALVLAQLLVREISPLPTQRPAVDWINPHRLYDKLMIICHPAA